MLCRKMFDFENTPKTTTAFLRVLMHVRNFSIAMKRELKMNAQNTRKSGTYLCVHFQRYLCARVEDRDTKRARFFLHLRARERRRNLFEFLKKRREGGEKKFKKNSKTHTRRSLVLTTAEDTSTLERLLSSRRRSKEILLFCYEQTIE